MPSRVKVSGAWKDAVPKVKVAGAWKDVSQAYVKVSGEWKALLSTTFIARFILARDPQVSDNTRTAYFVEGDGFTVESTTNVEYPLSGNPNPSKNGDSRTAAQTYHIFGTNYSNGAIVLLSEDYDSSNGDLYLKANFYDKAGTLLFTFSKVEPATSSYVTQIVRDQTNPDKVFILACSPSSNPTTYIYEITISTQAETRYVFTGKYGESYFGFAASGFYFNNILYVYLESDAQAGETREFGYVKYNLSNSTESYQIVKSSNNGEFANTPNSVNGNFSKDGVYPYIYKTGGSTEDTSYTVGVVLYDVINSVQLCRYTYNTLNDITTDDSTNFVFIDSLTDTYATYTFSAYDTDGSDSIGHAFFGRIALNTTGTGTLTFEANYSYTDPDSGVASSTYGLRLGNQQGSIVNYTPDGSSSAADELYFYPNSASGRPETAILIPSTDSYGDLSQPFEV